MSIGRVTNAAFRCAAAATLLLATPASAQNRGEVDPAAVSDGLKAIFNYSANSKSTRDRLNANTITLMSGTIGGTYVQFGADLASALDDGDEMRVLPIIGRGSVQSIADILFLKGVDLGIMRADTLDYLERKGYTGNIRGQFAYITKLYNEEMHVVAKKSIRSLADLNGRRVAVDLPNGGTFVTAITIFERLNIKPIYAFIEQRVAYEKLKNGELDAGKPLQGRQPGERRRSASGPDPVWRAAAERLPPVRAQGGGLSFADPAWRPCRHGCGAGPPGGL